MTAQGRLTVMAAVATLLASVSLMSIFQDGGWFWPVVSCIAVGAAGCALGRRLGLPRPIVPLLGLIAVTLTVTWEYARDVAVLGFFPGPGAWHALEQAAQVGMEGVRRYAAPAPTDTTLVLLAAAGVGLVAVMVDTLAVTYQSAPLAGVPLLAVYAVPVSILRGGVPWVLFLVGAVGWLALMMSEGRDRLSTWGRSLSRASRKGDNVFTQTPPEPVGVIGRRIGATAIGLALVLPALVPWVGTSIFSHGGGSGSGTGSGGTSGGGVTTIVNPFVTLGSDLTARTDSTVLTYTTNDLNPDYLRMVTNDTFDGKTWLPARMSSAGSALRIGPDEGSGEPGQDVSTDITTSGLAEGWLPMPYPVSSVDISENWQYDEATRDVFAVRGSTLGASYTVASRHLALSPLDLRAAGPAPSEIQDRYTQLPSIPASVVALTRRIIAGATTDYDKALALQNFFLNPDNGFSYSTDVPTYAGSQLVGFLTNRKGFCQQYAGAFAVMARIANLPTRVDVGFTPGTKTGTDLWAVSRHNTHAWPEVYFSGFGWVRFEPTVGGPLGINQPGWAQDPLLSTGGAGPGRPSGQSVTLSQHNADRANANENGPSARDATPTPVHGPRFPWALVLAILAVVALLVPGAGRLARRRGRLGGRGERAPARTRVVLAWRELGDTARDLRLPWSASRTPRRTAEWIVSSGVDDAAAAAARRLAGAVERLQYARADIDDDRLLGDCDPLADARRVAVGLEIAAPPRDRWRARLIPASVLAVLGGWSVDVLDAFDRVGATIGSGLRRLVPRRRAADA
jgi:transglutaminase-like putative cysteine protease